MTYKRNKVAESDKISGVGDKSTFVNRRFIVAPHAVSGDGIKRMGMGKILRNKDTKVMSFPVSSNVFKVAGGGQNYVHGGSSPQEMLLPVLDIKMERGHMERKNVEICLLSLVNKITSKIIRLSFLQPKPVATR